VIDYPAGATAGGVGDFWQRPLTDMGETGPDKGKGAKYLLLAPGLKAPKANGYTVIQSPTNNVFFAFRVLDPDPKKAKALTEGVKIYQFADRAKPKPTRLIRPKGAARFCSAPIRLFEFRPIRLLGWIDLPEPLHVARNETGSGKGTVVLRDKDRKLGTMLSHLCPFGGRRHQRRYRGRRG